MGMNFADMAKGAESAEESEDLQRFTPPDGLALDVEVVFVKHGPTNSGNGYGWGTFMKVLEGEYQGMAFWDNTYLTDGNDFGNKRGMAKLAIGGVPYEIWPSNPDVKAVAELLKGSQFTVMTGSRVDDKGRKNDDGTPKVWADHKWRPLSGQTFETKAPVNQMQEGPPSPARPPADGDEGLPWEN